MAGTDQLPFSKATKMACSCAYDRHAVVQHRRLVPSSPIPGSPSRPPSAALTPLQVGLDLRRVLAKDALNFAVEVRVAVVDVVNVLQ